MSLDPETYDIEIEHVTKRFGDFTAVKDMNLKIRKGEFFSMLGPSGCGKTTTLRMVAGFEQPTEGEIYVASAPVAGVPPYKRPVNTVFQNYALFPHLNVWENVAFGLKRQKVPADEMKKRVQEALEMVEMDKMVQRRPSQLSGGQQQRVALARALVNRPTVLLLDEPLGALDAKLRKAMQLELKKLQSDVGITFIYVTHDQEEALTMSDRLVVMSQGLCEQVGRPIDIYENPESAFVANFIGVSNIYLSDVISVTDGMAECRTDQGLGVKVMTGRHDVRAGQKVGVVIRPEKLFITPIDDVHEMEDRQNVYDGTIKAVVYIGSITQFIVDIEGKHLAQVLQQNLLHTERREWQQGQKIKVGCWGDSGSLITDVEKGMAEKDLMGEVVKRL
ncbi:MAG TPA: ABC transporter ATP-binding protein [Thermoleophilia bacterium]|nr:ABC transporter ATP-binding protein [Thermoleophilia bacterium]